MDRYVLLFVVVLGVYGLAVTETIQSTKADGWLGVTRCSGDTGSTGTGNFRIDHVEWRILWAVTLSSSAEFRMEIFEGTKEESFASIHRTWNDSDIFYVNEHTADSSQYLDYSTGTFHADVFVSESGFYSLVVEQNLDSIPEFPSFLILPLLMMATLLTVILHRRKHTM